jgi:hypothetical protein
MKRGEPAQARGLQQSAQQQRKPYTPLRAPASQLHTTRQDLVLSSPTALGVLHLTGPASCYTPARLHVTYLWRRAVPPFPLYCVCGVVSSADGDVCLWRCESARTPGLTKRESQKPLFPQHSPTPARIHSNSKQRAVRARGRCHQRLQTHIFTAVSVTIARKRLMPIVACCSGTRNNPFALLTLWRAFGGVLLQIPQDYFLVTSSEPSGERILPDRFASIWLRQLQVDLAAIETL